MSERPTPEEDGLLVKVLAEVLQIIFCSLDCEGTRKLASVNRLFRARSYSAVASGFEAYSEVIPVGALS